MIKNKKGILNLEGIIEINLVLFIVLTIFFSFSWSRYNNKNRLSDIRISDTKINELEIPTGNPLVIELEKNLQVDKYYYLDESRAKSIIFNQ